MAKESEGTTTTAETPEEERRVTVFNEMTPELKKVAKEFEDKFAREVRGSLLLRYSMGEQVKDVVEKEADYGANAVKQLADYLGKTDTELYTLKNVATIYSKDEIEALAQTPMANHNYITWSHITAIVQVRKAEDRKRYWKRVFAENLTASKLAGEIMAGAEKTHSRSGGRKPSKPTSPIAGVQQVFNNSQTLNNRFDETMPDAFDALSTIIKESPDEIDNGTVEKLVKARDELKKLGEHVTQYHPKLVKLADKCEEIVKSRAVSEAETAAVANAKKRSSKAKGKKAGGKKTTAKKGSRRPAAAGVSA